MREYTLYTDNGCIAGKVISSSFKKAREEFSERFSGKYKISWIDKNFETQKKNVIFR